MINIDLTSAKGTDAESHRLATASYAPRRQRGRLASICEAVATGSAVRSRADGLRRLLPGLALCISLAVTADLLPVAALHLFGRPLLDPVLVAILLGTSTRMLWCPPPAWQRGITCSAKLLLEASVVLLGASIDATTLAGLRPLLILSVALLVGAALTASYLLGRACRLSPQLAILIACGNAICGNAAIGAVAPLIGAEARDITAAVSYTAVFGLGVVLTLPALTPILHLSPPQYGELAGLTVYSVPQVLAATLPVGIVSSQIATMIKLLRVLMLGPVGFVIACVVAEQHRRSLRQGGDRSGQQRGLRAAMPIATLVPWFLVGFVGLAVGRSSGFVPGALLGPIAAVAHLLTVVSMAALGLNVDLRSLAACRNSIALTVAGSLVAIFLMSLTIVRCLPLF